MKLKSGHESVPLEGSELEKQQKSFKGYIEGLIRVSPGRWIFTPGYNAFADKIYDFKFKNTDVVIMTYPKCGTTWTQEIVWTMRNNSGFNHPMALTDVNIRAPFLEMDMLFPTSTPEMKPPSPDNPFFQAFAKMCPGKDPRDGLMYQMAENLDDPRTIKTHLPFSLSSPSLLNTAKVIYVARNPLDMIVSYHHHSRLINVHGFDDSFNEFVKFFLEDDLLYGPYWLHVKEAWERRNHKNLHFVFFEDLKANPFEEITKLDAFLGTNLSEEKIREIVEYTSFKTMKARAEKLTPPEKIDGFNQNVLKDEGAFFRKGQSGDWKGKLTPFQEAKLKLWTKKNMESFGIQFKYGV